MEVKKILIVDDETVISSYLERKFTKLGYTVPVANDGEEALKNSFSVIPDVILLDVKLPKLNGIEVCKRLKSDDRTMHIPVIIISAKAQSFEIRQGLDAGADRYLCKPVSFPDILKEIKSFEARK